MHRRLVHLMMGLLLAVFSARGLAEIPIDVLIPEKHDACCDSRIELTGGRDAYLWQYASLVPGAVSDQNGSLLLEFKSSRGHASVITLTAKDDAWIDGDGDRWISRNKVLKPTDGWTPVRIHVTDSKGKGLGEFSYRYSVESKDGRWDPMLVRPLQSKDGIAEMLAPEECDLTLSVDHPDVPTGYGTEEKIERKAGKMDFDAKFETGQHVTGKVVDSTSGKPLAGAVVSPLMFTPPLFSPDLNRSVTSDEKGAFDIRGVHSAFAVDHPDYVVQEIYLDHDKPVKAQVIKLVAGQTIKGLVEDANHKPLAGVRVMTSSGKGMFTGDDGRFVLRGLPKARDDGWSLSLDKQGFNGERLDIKKIDPDELKIQMKALPHLRGNVVGPDGKPASSYHLICGPGENPADYESEKETVENPNGAFDIQPRDLPDQGNRYWIGVWSEGAAPWEGVVDLEKLESGDFQISLEAGVNLTATLDANASTATQLDVLLQPVDRQVPGSFTSSDHAGKDLATKLVTVKRGEPLKIFHLRGGSYQLSIEGKGATPTVIPVTIGKSDVDLGAIHLAGTGSISGVARDPYKTDMPWRFADGEIQVKGIGEWNKPYQTFKTDGEGRFHIDDVPTGDITVSFVYGGGDLMSSKTGFARVLAGKNTEMRFEELGGAWTQPLRLLFDGKEEWPVYKEERKGNSMYNRDPRFEFKIAPMNPGPSSNPGLVEWVIDKKSAPAIPDLSAGRWKIEVHDDYGWLGETIAEVGEKREPIAIELGGGALSGKVVWTKKARRVSGEVVDVLPPLEEKPSSKKKQKTKKVDNDELPVAGNEAVEAVSKSTGRVYFSASNAKGEFLIRYLPQGEYVVHVHDDEGGWCDLGTRNLNKPLVDCGEAKLVDGGHVIGTLDHLGGSPEDREALKVVAADGVEIPVDELDKDGSYRFANIRPGSWTLFTPTQNGEIQKIPIEVEKGKITRVQAK